MQVSEVRLNLLKTDNAVKAIGSFSLDGAFAVRGVRVMEDKNGRNFVAFPSREKADGSYEDIAFPLSKELFTSRVLSLVSTVCYTSWNWNENWRMYWSYLEGCRFQTSIH